jgi:hypothetical protein
MAGTALNVGSIAIAVRNRYPTKIGSDVLDDMAYDNTTHIEALTGEAGLQTKFIPAIIALTAADAIRKDASDADVSLADFSVGGNSANVAIKQLEDRANRVIKKFTTRSVSWARVN